MKLEEFVKISAILDSQSVPPEERSTFIWDKENDTVILVDLPLSEEQAKEIGCQE